MWRSTLGGGCWRQTWTGTQPLGRGPLWARGGLQIGGAAYYLSQASTTRTLSGLRKSSIGTSRKTPRCKCTTFRIHTSPLLGRLMTPSGPCSPKSSIQPTSKAPPSMTPWWRTVILSPKFQDWRAILNHREQSRIAWCLRSCRFRASTGWCKSAATRDRPNSPSSIRT